MKLMIAVTTKTKIFIAELLQFIVMGCRRLFGLGTNAIVTRGGIRWNLDLNEGIDFSIYLLGSFEPLTVRSYRQLIKPGDIVLDVGANIGAHSLVFAKCVGPEGEVIAFEPTQFAFTKLNANLELNPQLKDRVIPTQLMLVSNDMHELPDTLYSSWPLSSSENRHDKHFGKLMGTKGASSLSLDSFISQQKLSQVDFMKVDIDGHEVEMFRGAHHTLATMGPPIVMEISPHQLEEYGASVEELLEILVHHKYELFDLSSGAKLPSDPEMLKKSIPYGGSINALAKVCFG